MRTYTVLLLQALLVGLAYSAILMEQPRDNSFGDDDMNMMMMKMMFDDDEGFPQPPPSPISKDPCCAPSQWEGDIFEKIFYMKHGPREEGDDSSEESSEESYEDDDSDRHHGCPDCHGHGGKMMIYGKVAVDGQGKRVAMQLGIYKKPHPTNMTIILDFNKKAMYFADMTRRTCKKAETKGEMHGMCIPKNATYGGNVQYGAGNKNSMTCDMWNAHMFHKGMRPMMVKATVLVTEDLCVPFWHQAFAMGRGFKSMSEVTFMNLSTKISDPGVFTPPSFCTQAEYLSDTEDFYASHLLKIFQQ